MKKVNVPCSGCNKKRMLDISKNNPQKYLAEYPLCHKCKMPDILDKVKKGWFIKGSKPWNVDTKGLVKPNKGSFKKGVRASSLTEFKKGQDSWNKGKEFEQIKGEKHFNWKGDGVGYSALHKWIANNFIRSGICDICKTRNPKRFEWDNISGEYKRNINDWRTLCSKCHANKHKNWEARWLV